MLMGLTQQEGLFIVLKAAAGRDIQNTAVPIPLTGMIPPTGMIPLSDMMTLAPLSDLLWDVFLRQGSLSH